MICFLYVIGLTATLGLIATLLEPVLAPRGARRWVWLGAVALAMVVPPVYQAAYHAPIDGRLAPITAYDTVLVALWRNAMWGLVLWGAASALLIAMAVRRARKQRNGPDIVDGVPVVITDKLGPATAGFWRARVLIPHWALALPRGERKYIVQHEEEHRKAHDGRMLFLASLPLVVVPWNIAMWWLVRRLALAIEMDCDQRVVSTLGEPRKYASLLLDVAQAGGRGPRLQPGFIGGAVALEQRLRALLQPNSYSRTFRYLAVAAAIVLLCLALSVPHPVLGAH